MKHLSLALFAVASLFFVIGFFTGSPGTMSPAAWSQHTIALYLAAIGAHLIFNRETADK